MDKKERVPLWQYLLYFLIFPFTPEGSFVWAYFLSLVFPLSFFMFVCIFPGFLFGRGQYLLCNNRSDPIDQLCIYLAVFPPFHIFFFFRAFSAPGGFWWPGFLGVSFAVSLLGILYWWLIWRRPVLSSGALRRWVLRGALLFLLLGALVPAGLSARPAAAPAAVDPPTRGATSPAYASGQAFPELDDRPATGEITGSLSRTAYWTDGGGSYHFSSNCTSLKRSKTVRSGTLQQALDAGKTDPCNLCAGGS